MGFGLAERPEELFPLGRRQLVRRREAVEVRRSSRWQTRWDNLATIHQKALARAR
jgi:hypothetical protein